MARPTSMAETKLPFSALSVVLLSLLLPFLGSALTAGGSILSPFPRQYQSKYGEVAAAVGANNIILNPRFEDGLKNWSAKGCRVELHESMADGKIVPQSGKLFVSATDRTETWNGIEQELTGRVQREVAYGVTAIARIYGNVTAATLQLTLWVQEQDRREEYISIASLQVTDKDWVQLQGEFLLNGFPSRVIIYFEGPPAGTDILINSLIVQHAAKMPSSARPVFQPPFDVNVIENSNLDDGTTAGWFALGNCLLTVERGSPYVLPPMARDSLGPHESLSSQYMRVTNRTESWMGPAQIVTDKLRVYLTYQVSASAAKDDENLIVNPNFEDGSNNWSGRGCKIAVQNSAADGKIVPQSGKVFAVATGRTQNWHGIQQEITGRVQRKLAYEVTAVVRIYGNNVTSADVRATLWVKNPDNREQYIGIANLQAKDSEWVQLQGKFLLNGSPNKIVVYLEGPPPGTDLLVNSFTLKHATKVPPSPLPIIENPAFGVNILQNSNLSDATNGWFPLGNCSLNVATGSPHVLPPMARESLGVHESLSGRCIAVTKRTQTWMGPAQMITDKVKLFLTYQISAWVKIVPGAASGPQNVNVALGVDNNWVNGGQVEINDDRWHEIGGSFRIEKQPSKVMVYIQGPAGGVDFMVAGLQIFAVDRVARFKHLRRHADKIRKRDVTLKFTGGDSSSLHGTFVKVRQTQNSFPLGTCISRTNIDNEDFVDFFVKNFNWAVFGNELKWYWTESQQGNLNYKDADDLVELCRAHNIDMRGHCIFWDVDGTVQPWIKSLNKDDLMKAVQNRITDLLTRYKGKFKHYDVNNEMLHGSFYQDRLGKDIRPYMFKTANQLDPFAALFVNDYHVEDGCDTRSTPERYIEQVLDLQERGAAVGGIGIQGHIDSPVGPVVCSALDGLGILGLPIWFTELDVSSTNEYIRAEDLEVMLREAFAHPSVEGVMLWGFWELFMSRENSHLVEAEGEVNEAGRRLLALKKEWLSHASGEIDESGEFGFRGFHGSYRVEVVGLSKKVTKTFVVEKGDGDTPLVLNIDLSSS
ncbi:unnamed protein product [Linum tenue]|uniref:GH10 domain-containing protein n=1 Tax=Linum tenue TaxID=586396 RepID=A0AAV0P133_9ROSI|nr:unnamed protein product [Linum tenue]